LTAGFVTDAHHEVAGFEGNWYINDGAVVLSAHLGVGLIRTRRTGRSGRPVVGEQGVGQSLDHGVGEGL
jgi:hypothetical protein